MRTRLNITRMSNCQINETESCDCNCLRQPTIVHRKEALKQSSIFLIQKFETSIFLSQSIVNLLLALRTFVDTLFSLWLMLKKLCLVVCSKSRSTAGYTRCPLLEYQCPFCESRTRNQWTHRINTIYGVLFCCY